MVKPTIHLKRLSISTPCGTNKGNITAAKNKTVIKGIPLQNSINIIDKAFTTGNLDLLPKARIIPSGSAKIIPIKPNNTVKKAPPHLCVLTDSNPSCSLPCKRKKAMIGYATNKNIPT